MEGDRLLSCGQTGLGLAYLGLALAQPFSSSMERQEIDRVLARTSLSPDEIESGLAAGAALDLDAVVADLLAEGD